MASTWSGLPFSTARKTVTASSRRPLRRCSTPAATWPESASCSRNSSNCASASARRQSLAEFLVGERQPGLALDGFPKLDNGLFEAFSQSENTAEVFVEMRKIRPERQRLAQFPFGVGQPVLLHQGMAEEPPMIGRAGMHEQVVAADFLGS